MSSSCHRWEHGFSEALGHTASKWQGRDLDLDLPDVRTPFRQVRLPGSVGFQGQTRVATSFLVRPGNRHFVDDHYLLIRKDRGW